ncbi:MAG: DNA repair protein [Spirochaetales bacterium]|nr:DNA repair protein [Spirochaetales bacterium]
MSPRPSRDGHGCGGAVAGLYRELLRHYGPQGWWPLSSRAGTKGFDERGYHPGNYRVPASEAERLEVVVGAVLTQNTSWRNAERALERLLRQGLMSRAALLSSGERELAEAIHPSGYYNQKARKLRLVVQALGGGPRPPERELLLGVWGVGPETADSILLYAYHVPSFVVDAYTQRLVSRLGWIEGREGYHALQGLFAAQLPPDPAVYGEFHALIVRHAKEHCLVRPRCGSCPLTGGLCVVPEG